MIYFVRDSLSGHIKVGYADDPWKRLSKIQSDCPGDVTLIATEEGGVEREAELHAMFAEQRLRGEWFRGDGLLGDYVAALAPAVRPLKYRRTRAFWNGKTSSEVSRVCEVSTAHTCEIASGKRRPSPELAMRIQRFTGLSAIALVFGADAQEAAAGFAIGESEAA
jgi:hypothetical protein